MEEPKKIIIVDDAAYETLLTKKYTKRKKFALRSPKEVRAYIPGTILKLFVKPGDSVRKGDKLLILEAMKMKNTVNAPEDVVIKATHIREGLSVMMNQLLLEFE